MTPITNNPYESGEDITSQVHERFRQLTEIGPTITPESNELINILAETSVGFLGGLKGIGLVSEEEIAQVADTWKAAIPLDRSNTYSLLNIMSTSYLANLWRIYESDPEGKDPILQTLKKQVEESNDSLKSYLNHAYAFFYTPQAVLYTVAGITIPTDTAERYLIINMHVFEQVGQDPSTIRMVAFEESLHMLSKIKDYGDGADRKWVEETLARIIAVNCVGGHNEATEEKNRVKQVLRYDDYRELYLLLMKKAGVDDVVLANMFFGREPLDSPDVQKVLAAIKLMDKAGELVDRGAQIS